MKDFTYLMTSTAGISHFMRENADGSTTFAASQANDPILDYNQKLRTENDGYSPSRELRRVASIPMALIYKWKHEEGWDAFDPEHADKLKQKLNDPDYAYLRTADGRIGMSNGILR